MQCGQALTATRTYVTLMYTFCPAVKVPVSDFPGMTPTDMTLCTLPAALASRLAAPPLLPRAHGIGGLLTCGDAGVRGAEVVIADSSAPGNYVA